MARSRGSMPATASSCDLRSEARRADAGRPGARPFSNKLLKAGNDSARSFYFAVQQLSVHCEVNDNRLPELPLSLANNVEFLRHFPRLNGFNGLGIYGRNSSPGASSPLAEIDGFGTNPGALRMFAFVPEALPRAPRSRRRAARLRPDRGRLRFRHRLVDARQALWLCAADAGAAGLEQRQYLLQLVQSGRYRARPWRSRFDPADDRADGRRPSKSMRAASTSPGFPPAAP